MQETDVTGCTFSEAFPFITHRETVPSVTVKGLQ